MDIKEIRLKCLQIAAEQLRGHGMPAALAEAQKLTVDRARAFEAYINQGETGSASASDSQPRMVSGKNKNT